MVRAPINNPLKEPAGRSLRVPAVLAARVFPSPAQGEGCRGSRRMVCLKNRLGEGDGEALEEHALFAFGLRFPLNPP